MSESVKNIGTIVAAVGFLGCIVAANYVTSRYGMVPVGFGLMATAGTYFAGATFVLRDYLHDKLGRWPVVVLIVVGALLSYALSAPFIALASGVAFLVAEFADMFVYTPLREHGYIRAAIASNTVGAFVDTIIFLAIAGFPIWVSVPGQMVGKLAVTAAVVIPLWIARAVLREPVRP